MLSIWRAFLHVLSVLNTCFSSELKSIGKTAAKKRLYISQFALLVSLALRNSSNMEPIHFAIVHTGLVLKQQTSLEISLLFRKLFLPRQTGLDFALQFLPLLLLLLVLLQTIHFLLNLLHQIVFRLQCVINLSIN